MTRVVVKGTKAADLEDAIFSCPVNAFRKIEGGLLVISPEDCIDCGVCQTECPAGTILEDSEAKAEDTKFNAEQAKTGTPAQ